MKFCKSEKGFTLAEMMIAVAISGIVLGGVFTAFIAQRKSYEAQEEVTDMQQSMRASMYMLTSEIRMAGYDPTFSRLFGFTAAGVGANAVTFTLERNDVDGDGVCGVNSVTGAIEANGVLDANETITYAICDANADGTQDLCRTAGGGGQQLVAENVISLGFAYAYDSDGDRSLETYVTTGGTNAVIWAIDSNNDGNLDRNLDTNADGTIDEDDSLAGVVTGTALGAVVPRDKIRAVKIWLLARSSRQDAGGFVDTFTYVVGNQVITPNTNFRHRLLSTTVYCRNLGLNL